MGGVSTGQIARTLLCWKKKGKEKEKENKEKRREKERREKNEWMKERKKS